MMKIPRYRNLILASASPRRRFLLAQTGLEFTVLDGDVSEDYPAGMEPEQVAVHLSEKKASHFASAVKDDHTLVITADTIVLIEGQILGKPGGYEEAVAMLQTLSGKKHVVITAVTLKSLSKTLTFTDFTDVYFKELSREEISFYLENFKPYDKAGSYGIQEWIGYIGIERIDGSYFNVMGMPLHKLYRELMNF
jgi:septum formation protein